MVRIPLVFQQPRCQRQRPAYIWRVISRAVTDPAILETSTLAAARSQLCAPQVGFVLRVAPLETPDLKPNTLLVEGLVRILTRRTVCTYVTKVCGLERGKIIGLTDVLIV